MTSSVKFTAHCSDDKRLYVCTTRVDHTGAQRKSEDWLRDGQSLEVAVYDSARAHAFEVDASTVPADYVPNPQIVDHYKDVDPQAALSPETIVAPASLSDLSLLPASPAQPGVDSPAEQVIEVDPQAAPIPASGVNDGVGNDPAPGFDADPVDSASGN